MLLTDLIVFGCGAQALYVLENRTAAGLASPVAAVDLEGRGSAAKPPAGVAALWTLEQAMATFDPARHEAIMAHGDGRLKLAMGDRLAARGARFASAIHPQAMVSPRATLGGGCIVNAGAMILPQARIGEHVIIHSGAVIDHDCVLERGVNVAPGAALAGRVTVAEGAIVYTGAAVAPKVHIGAFAVVGAGAVVIRDVPDGATVAGNPARLLAATTRA